MKRLLLLLFALSLPALAATPITVSGNIQVGNSSGLKGNAFVRFRLRNFAGFVPRIVGSGVIVQTQFDVRPTDTLGTFSSSVYSNDDITPNTCGVSANLACTWWTVEFWNDGKVSSSGNYCIPNTSPTYSINSATPCLTPPLPPPPFPISSGGVTGSGTTNKLPKWINTTVLGDTAMFSESGSTAQICNGAYPSCTGGYLVATGTAGSTTRLSAGDNSSGPGGALNLSAGNAVFSTAQPVGNVVIQGSTIQFSSPNVTPSLQIRNTNGDSIDLQMENPQLNNSAISLNLSRLIRPCGNTTTCSNISQSSSRIIYGTVTLSSGTATITGISPGMAGNSNNVCWATDKTAANLARAVMASTTSVTVTGTGTDVISWACVGN